MPLILVRWFCTMLIMRFSFLHSPGIFLASSWHPHDNRSLKVIGPSEWSGRKSRVHLYSVQFDQIFWSNLDCHIPDGKLIKSLHCSSFSLNLSRCKVNNFVANLTLAASVFTITVTTFDRYGFWFLCFRFVFALFSFFKFPANNLIMNLRVKTLY